MMEHSHSSFVVRRWDTGPTGKQAVYRDGKGGWTSDVTQCARYYSFSGLELASGESLIEITTQTTHKCVFTQK